MEILGNLFEEFWIGFTIALRSATCKAALRKNKEGRDGLPKGTYKRHHAAGGDRIFKNSKPGVVMAFLLGLITIFATVAAGWPAK